MRNFLDFKGKTALVTGAAGAIGKGVALGLAQRGARVVVTDLKQDTVDAVVAEMTSAGYDVAGLAADVTDESRVKAVVELAATRFDKTIDILVNVAGVAGQKPVEEITEKRDFVFAVNCKGTFFSSSMSCPDEGAQVRQDREFCFEIRQDWFGFMQPLFGSQGCDHHADTGVGV